MAKGRKRGCPVNVKNWVIEIYDNAEEEWVRIYGLTSLNRSTSGDTNDGSMETDKWEEPYITKRSAELSLEGEYIEDETTGIRDRGQELLNWYGDQVGCENDATIRMTDPYGHCTVADYVITSAEDDWDNEEASCSWDLEMVGEPEYVPYVHVKSIYIDDPETEFIVSTDMTPDILKVHFVPENASNKRFRVYNSKPSVAKITDITDDVLTVQPLQVGTTRIKVVSVNQAKTFALTYQVMIE